MKVYISGPMTNIPGFNVQEFNRAEAILLEFGHSCFNPAKIADKKWPWSKCMRHDIKELMECDVLVYIDGWESSRGAVLEGYIASSIGMELYTLEKFLEINRGGVA